MTSPDDKGGTARSRPPEGRTDRGPDWPKVEYTASKKANASPTRLDLSAPPPDLPVIGRYAGYDVLGRLAMGGMAEILLARRPERPDEVIVVKRILRHFERDTSFLQMFLDEAQIGMQLRHPNICRFFKCGEADDSHFISMEWVNGVTLGRMLERTRDEGGVPIRAALRIIANIARGLDYAHRARGPDGEPLKLIHRDVSPHNVAISFHGEVKLLDFGIAKAAQQTHRTQSGVVKGKFAYMAPEQCVGAPLDNRADIFALGLCLFEVLTGRSAYRRKTEAATMRAIMNEPVPPLGEEVSDPSHRLTRILRMALAKKPNERFATAAQLAAAVEHYAESIGGLASERELGLLVRALFPREFKSGPAVDAVELRTSGELESIELTPVPAKSSPGRGPLNQPRTTLRAAAAPPEQKRAEVESPAPPAAQSEPRAPGGVREFDLDDEDAGYSEMAALFENTDVENSKLMPAPEVSSRPASMSDPSAVTGAAAAAKVHRGRKRAPRSPSHRRPVQSLGPRSSAQSPRPLLFVLLALFACSALFIVVSYWHRNSRSIFGEKMVVLSDNPLLQEQGARILVASSPPGAGIYLDGDPVGETPASLTGLRAGSFRLTVKAPGFAPWSEEVVLSTGDTLAITARLVPRAGGQPGAWGALNLTTVPKATVFVGGDRLGDTPLEAARVPAGHNSLEFRLQNGRRIVRRILVTPGQVVTKELSLK